jgi:hypothetical protein
MDECTQNVQSAALICSSTRRQIGKKLKHRREGRKLVLKKLEQAV